MLDELRESTTYAIEKKISLNPIINSFQNTVNRYDIERPLIDSFLASMEYDLTNQSCTVQDFKKYIKGSAEAVGLMCLQIFSYNKEGQYQKLKSYAESLGSAFQKINFLRDMDEDYGALGRIYFPNLNIAKFSNFEKKLIEDDIAQDFSHSLLGIKLLDKNSRKGVYLAYKYYMSLFRKIKSLDTKDILEGRVRVSNIRKIIILILAQIELKIS